MSTRIYFIRHALPVQEHTDDRTRPLTAEGVQDTVRIRDFLKDRHIDAFYCSPYRRSLETIRSSAEYYHMEIITDERFRERESGPGKNNFTMFRKRWADHEYHEAGGESISSVQKRNVAALQDVLAREAGKNIVIGTHGTALSSIMNYYYPDFSCDDFLRILDWMPYVLELDFEGTVLTQKTEHLYVDKKKDAQTV